MIIKNYIHGDPDCNYEKYLLEFVNASDFFRVKSDGDIYQSPESEENGQCDCISTSYQFDFKLIASKTALQARSILYPSKTEIVKGIIVTSEPKVKNGSIKATRIHAALRGYDFEGLRELRITAIKKQGVENDLTATKIEEIEKNLAEEKAKWSTQEPCVTAYQIYHDTMLNKGDPALKTKATSKAIVAQCLASNLRWAITEIASAGEGGTPLPKERMFDLDLFQTHIDEAKRVTLAEEIEKDPYLSYLILAIKHAAGIEG